MRTLKISTSTAANFLADMQSALDPAGSQAWRVERLWWIFFWVCLAVYVIAMAFVLLAVARRTARAGAASSEGAAPPAPGGGPPGPPDLSPPPARERRLRNVVGGAVGVTAAVLICLLAGDIVTGKAVHSLYAQDAQPLVIQVTGHQWWWELKYIDPRTPSPSDHVTTANELHLPVGKAVKVELNSTDVIHSFWIPNLSGKKDMIPGHRTSIMLKADRPGVFRGQCAEFCGAQHAQMRLVVVAEDPQAFDRWLNAQRQPAPEPQTDLQKKGQQVFLTRACVMCHTIQGTPAHARLGPSLTHVASRQMIGAGARPNAPGHLAGWIIDPQKIKPGVRMPQNSLKPDELQALLEYLATLK